MSKTIPRPEQLTLDREEILLPELVVERGPALRNATLDWLYSGKRRTDATREVYVRALVRFAAWWRERFEFEDLQKPGASGSIGAYLEELGRGPDALAPSSVRKDLTALRTWFDHLIVAGVLTLNPARAVAGPPLAPPKDRPHIPELSSAGVKRVLAAIELRRPIDFRDHALMLTFLHTGIRVSALCAFKVGDLQLRADGAVLVSRRGKRGKSTEFPVGRRPLEALLRLIVVRAGDLEAARACDYEMIVDLARAPAAGFAAAREPLFTSAGRGRGTELTSRPLSRFDVNNIFEGRAKAAGVPKFSPHSLRATFATTLLEQGADLKETSEAMQHASISTTEIYDRRRHDRRKLAELIKW